MPRDRLLDAVETIAKGSCVHCAKAARSVVTDERRTFDATWRVVALAAGCTLLSEADRVLARSLL